MNVYTSLPAGSRVSEAVRALGGPGAGTVLGYYPVSRLNPFQSLLYGAAADHAYAPVPLFHPAQFEALDVARRMGTATVLHIHWTSEVLAKAETASDAAKAIDVFLALLVSAQAGGTKLVWSVHNVLPHACRLPESELDLRRRLADLVDVVHVLTPVTIEETAPHFTLPADRVLEVPHPSYLGAYPTHHSGPNLRLEMGFARTDLVVGLTGSIQPYKGIETLTAATTEAAASNPDLRVLVAGIPGKDPASIKLLADLDAAPHIRSVPRKIDVNEMAMIMTVLDAAVLPYRASLNSGAALLALSFGKPIVAPRIGDFRTLIDHGFGIGFEPGDQHDLVRALKELPEFLDGFDPADAFSFCQDRDGRTISNQFFTHLDERPVRAPSTFAVEMGASDRGRLLRPAMETLIYAPGRYWPDDSYFHRRNREKLDRSWRRLTALHQMERDEVLDTFEHVVAERQDCEVTTLYIISHGSAGSHLVGSLVGGLSGFALTDEIYFPPELVASALASSSDRDRLIIDFINYFHTGTVEAERVGDTVVNIGHLRADTLPDSLRALDAKGRFVLLLRNPYDVAISRTFRKPEYRDQTAPGLSDREYLLRQVSGVRNFLSLARTQQWDQVITYESIRADSRPVIESLATASGRDFDPGAFETVRQQHDPEHVARTTAPSSSNLNLSPRPTVSAEYHKILVEHLGDLALEFGYHIDEARHH